MSYKVDKPENCLRCERSFEEVTYHSSGKCRNCYNILWIQNRDSMTKKPKLDHCVQCKCLFGSISQRGKKVLPGSKSMCKTCYNRYYLSNTSTTCRRCDKEMNKKIKGVCSLCRIELDNLKAPSRRTLPQVSKIKIDKDTKEMLRKTFNRYKFGTNTLADPFVVTDLYLTVFSSEATKGQTASKNEFNLDQFDQENQVIAMLKLLKMAYDKAI